MVEAIKITGIDESRTQPVEHGSAMYLIYLALSGQPTADWRRAFEERRKFPRHSTWRHAWIEGDSIVINCPFEELKPHHLNGLKEDVEVANQQAAAMRTHQEAAAKQDEAERVVEHERIQRLKNDLQF